MSMESRFLIKVSPVHDPYVEESPFREDTCPYHDNVGWLIPFFAVL